MMWEVDESTDLWADAPAARGSHGDNERFVTGELTSDDLDVERSLRPQRLDDYCGQDHIKQSLKILIEAAQSRGESLDHVIFSGPPGLGKTTLAAVVANEMGAQIKTTSGPAIARTGDLAAILTNLQPGDVLFIDEIHRLNRQVEEILYPAMEDFSLDIVIGKGPAARSIRLDIPHFTLVGATTRSGMLTGLCATALAYRSGSTTTVSRTLPISCAAPPPYSAWRSTASPPRRWRRARVERPVWRTDCSSACAIMPRCAGAAASIWG